MSAYSKQVGGEHYVNCAIQPLEYAVANELDPFQFSIIKYTTRMYKKGQCLNDIDKIIHFAELAKENAIKRDLV